jgi:hypothetical protein
MTLVNQKLICNIEANVEQDIGKLIVLREWDTLLNIVSGKPH